MMNISITKMNMVIDDLRVSEMTYKNQLCAFEDIIHGYKSIDQEQNDKRSLLHIYDDLKKEYSSLIKLRTVLEYIVKEYENTEKEIIKFSLNVKKQSLVFNKIDIEDARRILEKFNITIN